MSGGDTIAAIATAPGRGGVAVVRVSGSEAFGIARKLTGRTWGARAARETREVGFARIRPPVSPVAQIPLAIDEAVILAFRAPHSYTGEDVVEFQCHGGAVTPRRVLEACLAAGARLARRGEFTERAFLNGKIDYDQAESVLDLVDAKTARAADAALEGLAGRRHCACRALYDAALDLSTRLEHALDVDEGELADEYVRQLRVKGEELKVRIEEAIRKAHEGKLLRAGALVVLAGPPNAGKSSLLNALLEENRAIVSEVPGTTRDSIEAWIDLDGWPVRLVDTAGLREATDEIEGEGVKRSEELIDRADVVIWLDTVRGASPRRGAVTSDGPVSASTRGRVGYGIRIHAKCDLGRGEGLNVSSVTGEGLEDLKREIVVKLEAKVAAADEGVTLEGDVAAYHEALAVLDGGLKTEDGIQEEDLVLMANAVRAAAERLGAAVGETYSADLLDKLFSRFCVGK